MTHVEILDAARDRAGGYKVDVSHGERIGRISHAAGARGVVGALDLRTDEGIDLLVALDLGARLNLAAAVPIEGGLREDLARQPNAGAHFHEVVWVRQIVE